MVAIECGELLDVLEHPKQQRYPGQRALVVRLIGDVHLVPYGENGESLFQKRIIPSRNAQRHDTSPAERWLHLHNRTPRSNWMPKYSNCPTTTRPIPKDQRIHICLSRGDLQAIRTRALQEEIPDQSLISSVLHKDVSGSLREGTAPQ